MGGGVNHFPGRRRSIVAARQTVAEVQAQHVAHTVAVAFDDPPAPVVVVMPPPEPERRKPGRPKKSRP